MGAKPIYSENLSDTLNISEMPATSGDAGFWLWDETRGMNLAMRCKTREEALIEAISYYQERLSEKESRVKKLETTIENFVDSLKEFDDDFIEPPCNCDH